MNSTLRSLVFWMVLVVVVVLIWNVSTQFQAADDAMTFSDFLRQVDAGEVQSVELAGNDLGYRYVLYTRVGFKAATTLKTSYILPRLVYTLKETLLSSGDLSRRAVTQVLERAAGSWRLMETHIR